MIKDRSFYYGVRMSTDMPRKFSITLFSDYDEYENVVVNGDSEEQVLFAAHTVIMETDREYRIQWQDAMNKPLLMNTVKSTNWMFGCVSLVGCSSKEFPLGHGNYFSMILDKDNTHEFDMGIGIINIWYENLKEAIKRFDIKELTFECFEGGMIVTAPEIPDDWYIEGLFMKYNCNISKVNQLKILKHKGIPSVWTGAKGVI